MSHCLIVLLLSVYSGFIHAQSIYYGDHFVCDSSTTSSVCQTGDNIVCNAYSDCSVQCNDGCDGVIINAKMAKSLAVTNCIDCDNMIIYCPTSHYKGSSNTGSICTLEITKDIQFIHIYAQEAFNDFNVIQSYSEYNVNHYLSSSSMHCGDLFMIEYQCTLDIDGNGCDSTDAQCHNYPISTISPTTAPTERNTHASIISHDDIETTLIQIMSTEPQDVNEDESDDNNDERVTVVTETHNHNAHYVMLIIGLCIIWGSFFCCFIIMYYHREKKHELSKAVSIISRPKTPSKSKSKSKAKPQHKKAQNKSTTLSTAKARMETSQNESHTKACNIFLPVPEPSMMSSSRTLYKNKSVSNHTVICVDSIDNDEIVALPIKPPIKTLQDRRKIQSEAFTVEVIPSFSPGATPRYAISPRIDFRSPRLSPRPYFCDAPSNITPLASVHGSPRRQRPRLIQDDIYSNPMSNTTAEAVEIRLPCYDEHKQELESECVLETPQFTSFEEEQEHEAKQQHDIHEDEGSVSSKYASRQYREIMKGHLEDKEEEDDQTEGDDRSIRYDGVYPPPPPPSLDNNKKENMNIHNRNVTGSPSSMLSPSRHYRVKYSLGIQQDIKNCMSVPGFVGEKKFVFEEHKVRASAPRAQSVSPNGLLKPPTILSPSSSCHSYRKYYTAPNPPVSNVESGSRYYYQNPVTPQPVAQSSYLSFPENRPRIYSDPTFPANNLCN